MISCIIVEDEPSSQNILKKYVNDYPELNLISICANAYEAMDILQREHVALMFLDINLPKLSGLSFLKSLNNPPLVIFTTAYPKYAVDGFEVDAIDFLLKPFPYERFLKAVNKAIDRVHSVKQTPTEKHLLLQADKKTHKVNTSDILIIEAKGDYIKIQLADHSLLVHMTMIEMEKLLPKNIFIRIHKSYIINHSKVKYIEGNQVCINGKILPIGKTYKNSFMTTINSK